MNDYIHIEDYIKYIEYVWDDLKYLPKLNEKQISKFNEPYRRFLYVYYGYLKKLKTLNYSLEELKIKINDRSIYRLAAFL